MLIRHKATGVRNTTGSGRTAIRTTLAIFVVMVLQPSFAMAQASEKQAPPHVVLTGLKAPPGDLVAARVASTITSSLALILRLTNTVTVERADFLTPKYSLPTVIGYYDKVDAAAAVFGTVEPVPTGGYTINVQIWNKEKPNAPLQSFTKTIGNVLSSFSVVDELSLQVASSVVGRKLQVGTLVVDNTSSLPDFAVYADGQLLGRNQSSFSVLTGKHEVIVAKPGPLGDQPVELFHVDIKSKERTVIALKKKEKPPTVAKQAQPPAKPAPPKNRTAPQPKRPIQNKPKLTGSLSVNSTPAGATVYLDTKVLGTTPLSLFGVPTGKYTLRLERKYFLTTSQVVDINSGQTAEATVKLDLNQNDPALKAHLVSSGTASVDSLIWTGVQAVFVGAPFLVGYYSGAAQYLVGAVGAGYNSPPAIPAILSYGTDAIFLRVGQRYAHDRLGVSILDIGGAAATAFFIADRVALSLIPAPTSTGTTSSSTTNLYNTLDAMQWTIPAVFGVLSIFYDLVFSPQAAVKYNQSLLDTVARTGELPKVEPMKRHSIIVEAGGGSIVRGGYRVVLIPNYLFASATAGIAAMSYQPFRPAADVEGRLVVSPFGATTGSLRPVIFASVGGETNITQWSATVGGGIGADILLRHFDLFTRSEYRYGFVNKSIDGEFTVGVRF